MHMAAVNAVTELELGCHNMKQQKLATIGLCTMSYSCDSVRYIVSLFDHIQLAIQIQY